VHSLPTSLPSVHDDEIAPFASGERGGHPRFDVVVVVVWTSAVVDPTVVLNVVENPVVDATVVKVSAVVSTVVGSLSVIYPNCPP
jgi:hypothetical protein